MLTMDTKAMIDRDRELLIVKLESRLVSRSIKEKELIKAAECAAKALRDIIEVLREDPDIADIATSDDDAVLSRLEDAIKGLKEEE